MYGKKESRSTREDGTSWKTGAFSKFGTPHGEVLLFHRDWEMKEMGQKLRG